MGHEIEAKPLRVLFSGDFVVGLDTLEQLKENFKGICSIVGFQAELATEISDLAETRNIDVFILTLNNIIFPSRTLPFEDRIESSLKFLTFIKKTYGRPIIGLFGLPDDPSFKARAEAAGADFVFKIPFKIQPFLTAFQRCIAMVPGFLVAEALMPKKKGISEPDQTASRKSNKASPELGECKPILDACTPLLYRHNAFRISGLPVEATTRDIKRRIDDLKAAKEIGLAGDDHNHAFALKPTPNLDQIREAAQKLQDPPRRIVDEFFWFWPMEWGKGNSDEALSALCNNDKNTAFKIWSRAISIDVGPASITAKHNLAVMYHLVALDSEAMALKRNLAAEELAKISKYWRTSFRWWEDLMDNEAFWSLVTARIRMLDDPQLTTGFARRMKATLPEALGRINAKLAVNFAEKNKLPRAANHIAYVTEPHPWHDNVPKILADVTEPLKIRVRTAIDNAREVTERELSKGARCAEELLQAVKEPLRTIQAILPPPETETVDLLDSVADAALKCLIAYGKKTEDWKTCVDGLDLAHNYACTQEIKRKLAETRSIFADNQLISEYFEPLEKRIQKIETKQALTEKIHVAKTDLLSSLSGVEHAPGMSVKVYEACADLVAGYIRGLSVSVANEQSDLDTAVRTLNLAISLARGAELRNQLQEDKEKLAELKFSYDLKILVQGGHNVAYKLPTIVNVINTRLEELTAAKARDETLQVALYALRAFAIRVCNEDHKYELSKEVINLALQYALRMKAPDIATISMLRKDLSAISANALLAMASTSSSTSSSRSSCFIASAVYGPPDHPAVIVLRSFRDSVLMNHVIGRGFVAVYYRIGPYLADRVASSPFLKANCRKVLNRLVALMRCNTPVNDSLASKDL